MDLSDALDGEAAKSNQSNEQPGWPAWPGQPQNPAWPGQPYGPYPGQQPSMPSWPNQPYQPTWPGQPSQPNAPWWPGQAPPTAPQNVQLTVPFDKTLPQGVCDKLLITIKGEPTPKAKRFCINLTKNKDIAFHFNPRFDENGIKVIVRNTKINEQWGPEERSAPSFPFAVGRPFEVKILCTPNEYKVAVDMVHLLEYKHRILDLSQINHLSVNEDVKLTYVNIENLP